MIDVAISTKGEATVDKQLDKVDGGLKEIKKSADKASNSMSAGFKASAASAALIPGPIGMAATGMQGLTAATSTFVGALKTVKGALIATGVGAFVVVVGTLIAYFTETEKGAQKLRTIMAGLGAVVRTVADAMMSLDFRSLTTDLKDNTQAAIANAKALNAVEEAEGELTVKRAEANRAITEARLLADDLTKSTAERIHQVYLAGVIEKRVAEEELEIQRQRVAAMESNLNMKKDASEEERDLLEQAQVRLIELQNDTLKREKRLGTEVQSLKNEQAAKDKEADAARLEAIKERDAAEVELAKKRAEELEAALKAQYENELRLAQEAADGKLLSDEYLAERRARTAEEQLELEIERALSAEDEKFNAVMEALFAQDATKEEYIEAQHLYEQEQLAIENELRAEFNEKKLTDEEKLQADILKAKLDGDAKVLAAEKKIKDARLALGSSLASGLGSLGQIITTAQGEQTAASKVFALGQLAINTAMSISSAIAGATEAAAATGPGAVVATPVFIATQIATVLAAVAQASTILASVPGGGSASSVVSGAAASATSAPSVQPVTTNTTQLNNTEQAELMPIQAYVVETAITGSQGNVTQIESQATFGGG
jgi:hypothetical protein